MDAGSPAGAWTARKAENRRIARTPCPASLALSPADSRHRHQRLARPWKPRLADRREVDRGPSCRPGCSGYAAATCHGGTPPPSRCRRPAVSIRARASRTNGGPPPALVPARPELRPLFFRPFQQRGGSRWRPGPAGSAAPWPGAAVPGCSSPRHCSTYWISSRSRAGKAAHVDPFRPRAGIGAGGGELTRLRPAGAPPALVVGAAERRGLHRPPVAVGDPAGIRQRRGRRVVQGQPPGADAGDGPPGTIAGGASGTGRVRLARTVSFGPTMTA